MPPIFNNRPYYLLVLLATVAITLFFISKLGNLRFDYDFEAFFPNEDSELETYNAFRETFEHDNEFVLIAPENNDGIFRKDFLLKVDSLARMLNSLPNVKQVRSPTTLKKLSLDGLLPIRLPLLHFGDPSRYAADSATIYSNPALVGSFFPENALSLTIFVKTDPALSKKESDELAGNIRDCIARFSFDGVHVAGRVFAQKVYLEKLREEFILFISISFVLVIIFLWFSFRSLYGVVIPILVVLTSIVWTLGIMSLLGKSIDLMCSMLPTMIFIAGVSDVVHFFSKYFDARSQGIPLRQIYPLILKEVGFPTFLTLLTTSIAFLSLLFSSIKPVRDFGIYTTVGITIAFVLTYTLLPALLHFVKREKSSLPAQQLKFNGILRNSMFWVFRNQRTVLIIAGLLIMVSAVGISRLRVNNILLEDLDDSVRIKQDFMFFDTYYSGVRPFELEIKVKAGSIYDYNAMRAIHQVDSFVRMNYRPGFLASPAMIAAEIYRSKGLSGLTTFPAREEYQAEVLSTLKQNRKNREVRKFIRSDGRKGRISGKIRDMGSIRIRELNASLLDFISKNTDSSKIGFRVTGAAHLVDRNNEYMVNNMLQGFLFSVILISILTFLLHRSWRMVLVFILPNLIPLLIIAGIMGFAGIELKAATSIIFSIAFGIATDDTIHFISRLKIERGYGKSLLYAFKRTYFETGKPIVMTTFILLGGFMSLMTSSFQSTFYFGFLTCITILMALLADLFLLPVLLFLLYKKKAIQ